MDGNAFSIIASDDDFGSGFKTCTKCNEEKPLEEFHKGKSICKLCRSDKYFEKKVYNDMIQTAFDNAAYRILKEMF